MKSKKTYNSINEVGSSATSFSAGIFAILGGVCCWGPLVFSVLGVGASTGGILGSTASFLGAIAPYRNYFLLLNIIGILLSFFFIYVMPKISFQRKQASDINESAGGETCDCETSSGSFNFSKIVFFSSVFITIGIFIYLYVDSGQIFTAWPQL
ncbi:MAG: hypothetical protein ACP5NA_07675 [Candidatus Acidulodesulfobacterium sp.]